LYDSLKINESDPIREGEEKRSKTAALRMLGYLFVDIDYKEEGRCRH
jgi:hypothetical protein